MKLTPFEEYMFCDDHPDYPMTGFFRLRFSGKLDFCGVEAAIQTASARHPLLRSKVCRDVVHGNHWVTDETTPISLQAWCAVSQGEYPAASHIDLTSSAGTRIWLVDHETGSDLVVQIHHACTDALGMCQFIDDILILYADNTGEQGGGVQLRPIENQRLPYRNQFGLTWRKIFRILPFQILSLHVIGKFFVRKAAPLGLVCVDRLPELLRGFPAPITFDFDRVATSSILSEAKQKKATVNDLLTRDLFLAIDDWRTQNGVKAGKEWLRFFVPFNQRTSAEDALSAANIMSAVFLERNPTQLMNPETLLESIQTEMQKNKRRQLGFLFIAAQALMQRIPRLRNHFIRRGKCLSSCVFSNLGVILSRTPLPRRDGKLIIGNIVLDAVDFIAPLRPLTAAAFCICTYAGRLTVNLHFDPRSISRVQANELLSMFIRRIDVSSKTATPRPKPQIPVMELLAER